MTRLHTLTRTAVWGTALGLAWASSAVVAEPATVQQVWSENQRAATSLSKPAVAEPLVRKGTVLWHRIGDEQQAQKEARMSEELARLREAVERMQGQTVEQITSLQSKLASNEQTLQQVASDQARQEQRLQEQAVKTVSQVAQLAEKSMENMQQAVANSSQRLQQLESRQAHTETLQTATWNAVSSQVAANQQLTNMQLAELRKVADENRALASSETANVATALRVYADTQLAQARSSTSESLAEMARVTQQSVEALDERTSNRMGVLWRAASLQANKLAEEKANAVAASLAALQQQTAAQKMEPEQIRAIAERTVADAAPEFRALALQTLKDGQDYIRSVARSAVQDNDPGMTKALASAARDVITQDDKVVFAIRKAVADELQDLATGGRTSEHTGGKTLLGPDHGPQAAGEAIELDPNRLRIAQLLAPGGGVAPDAALTDAQLAAISPAAGQSAAGGQQAWSVPGTSLMRPRNRADWIDIRQYRVVVHQDNETLEQLLQGVLKRAEPFAGPWQVRWKISEENRDILNEKFSLDAEAPFEEFVGYLAQYIVNDRGVKLSVSLFDRERIIVISD